MKTSLRAFFGPLADGYVQEFRSRGRSGGTVKRKPVRR